MKIDKDTVVYLVDDNCVCALRFHEFLRAVLGRRDVTVPIYTDRAEAEQEARAAKARQSIVQDLEELPANCVKEVLALVAKLLDESSRRDDETDNKRRHRHRPPARNDDPALTTEQASCTNCGKTWEPTKNLPNQHGCWDEDWEFKTRCYHCGNCLLCDEIREPLETGETT